MEIKKFSSSEQDFICRDFSSRWSASFLIGVCKYSINIRSNCKSATTLFWRKMQTKNKKFRW